MSVKERMAEQGISQVEMMLELQKRGYTVQPPMMSSILRGVYTYPKAKQILAVCDEILKERENEFTEQSLTSFGKNRKTVEFGMRTLVLTTPTCVP